MAPCNENEQFRSGISMQLWAFQTSAPRVHETGCPDSASTAGHGYVRVRVRCDGPDDTWLGQVRVQASVEQY